MKLGSIVKTSFIISFIITVSGAILKMTHSDAAGTFLIIGVTATVVFMISTIIEVRSSKGINRAEKAMWMLAFLFFSGIAGLIYFLVVRRRIANL